MQRYDLFFVRASLVQLFLKKKCIFIVSLSVLDSLSVRNVYFILFIGQIWLFHEKSFIKGYTELKILFGFDNE